MAERPQYVTLGVAEELFAAPVEKVQEILDMRPIARLPQAPETLLGMIDVRGQGIPVVDLRLTLGLPPAPDNENTRILVLSLAGQESAARGRGGALPASAGAMDASSPCSISSACSARSRKPSARPETAACGLPDRMPFLPGDKTLPLSARQAAIRLDHSDDDHLSMRDFKRISDLIGAEVGIKLPPTKRLMVEGPWGSPASMTTAPTCSSATA